MNDETKGYTDEVALFNNSVAFEEAADLTFRQALKFWANERHRNERVVFKMQGGEEYTARIGYFKDERTDLDSDRIGWVNASDLSVTYINIHRIISMRIYNEIP